MSKLRDNHTGFTAVEGLLIILILVVVAFAGYYVWYTQENKTKPAASTTKTSASASCVQSMPKVASWKTYTFPKGDLSFKYPSSWQLQVEDITYAAPIYYDATITEWPCVKNANFYMDITYNGDSGWQNTCDTYCTVRNVQDIKVNNTDAKFVESSDYEACYRVPGCNPKTDPASNNIHLLFATSDQTVAVGQTNVKSQIELNQGGVTTYGKFETFNVIPPTSGTSTYDNYNLSTYNALPEVNIAKQIIESISY